MWSGQAVSLLGSQLVQFALIWWLTTETGSATVLAMASLVGLVPQVLLGPFVGVFVDRWNRQRTMILADSVVALATVGLAFFFWQGTATLAHVFVVLFLRALGSSFHWPAMQSSTILMVPEEQLMRIQGLNQTLHGGLNIASAPLGALLLELMPVQGILAIDVATALVAILPLLFIHVPQPEDAAAPVDGETAVRAFWRDMREGLRYVWSWPGMLFLMATAALINLVLTPAFSLMPLLVTDHFNGGALELGWLNSAVGAGVIGGGLLLGAWGGFSRRVYTIFAGLVGMGTAVALLGFIPDDLFLAAVAIIFVAGMMQAVVNGPIHALFQAMVAPAMQGRFFTLVGSLSAGMAPLGLILAGPIADWLGVRAWYVAGGMVTAVLGLASFFIPLLRELEEQGVRPAPPAMAPEIPLDTPASEPVA
jgi:DHA3 family macrolide efflux protein-like MFS transporter